MDCDDCGSENSPDASFYASCGSALREAGARHAGVWVRIAANVIDVIAMAVPVYLVVSLVVGFEVDPEAPLFTTADLVQVVLLGGITILLWVNWDGRTPGKKLLSIRIVGYPEYEAFSYGTALVRLILSLTPNPPKDTDGRREGSGRGWVRELQGRWPGVLG